MWLYRTSGDTDKSVVLYEYQPGRGAKHPKAFLEGYKGYLHFVIDFAYGDISRWDFDMDYSGYVIEHFPEFQREHPHLSRKFADTIERTYSTCSWMPDDRFQNAISAAVDEFLGTAPKVDIH